MELSRKDLYDLVWSMPMTKVGEKLGVSDVAIRKICVKMNIPRPPQGYWLSERLQKRPRPALPKFDGCDQILISPPVPQAVPEEAPPQLTDDVLALVAKGLRKTVTSDAGEAKRLLKSGFVDRYGFLRTRKSLPIPVIVTKETLQRALLLADWLIQMAGIQGFNRAEQRHGYGRDYEIALEKDGISVSIQIKERVIRREVPVAERKYDYGEKYRYEQAGELAVTFECGWESKRSIKDKGDSSVENRLGDMAVALNTCFQVAVEKKKRELIKAREREIQLRNDHREVWIQELETKRLENFQLMRDELEKNRSDRDFIDSVSGVEHVEWLDWVRSKLVVPDQHIVDSYSISDRDICISIDRLKEADASDDSFDWPKPNPLRGYY